MATSGSRSNDMTALRDALLGAYEQGLATWPTSAARTAIRLDRFRLGWLVGPWVFLGMLRAAIRTARPATSREEAVQRYAEVSGKPYDTSQAELTLVMEQLTLVDERAPYWHRPELAALRPATRTEVRATADALLQYYVNDRQSDDALLVEMQAAYVPCQQRFQQDVDRWITDRRRRADGTSDESLRQLAEAHRHYVQAWRRWFDHRQQDANAVR